jgi:hypothetical protein
MGAELVLSQPDPDVARFEQAVRARIAEFSSPTKDQQASEARLEHARYLVEQILLQIRAQAELKKNLSAKSTKEREPNKPNRVPAASKLFN